MHVLPQALEQFQTGTEGGRGGARTRACLSVCACMCAHVCVYMCMCAWVDARVCLNARSWGVRQRPLSLPQALAQALSLAAAQQSAVGRVQTKHLGRVQCKLEQADKKVTIKLCRHTRR